MNSVSGSTSNETKLIKAIQKSAGSVIDGLIGVQTLSDIAISIGAECWPLTVNIYSNPVIIAKDIVICNPKTALRYYANSLSGSFSYNRMPCSILVNAGKTICSTACHAFLDKPESVLYRLYSGEFGIKRCKYSTELPDNVKWAVGGLGLLEMYSPTVEGFTGAYSDVLRKTNHTAFGIKNNMCYLIYCKNMTVAQVNTYIKDKLKLDIAIMLDGGHVAAINGDESFAKINISQVQYYMIQAV